MKKFIERFTSPKPHKGSRREERRSSSTVRASHDSFVGGTTSPRPVHSRQHSETSTVKGRLANRQRSSSKSEDHQHPSTSAATPASSNKLKSMLKGLSSSPVGRQGNQANDQLHIKELQQHIQVLEAQQQDYDMVKQQARSHQQAAEDWHKKWNMQNFKLNLVVDMLVMRVLELEHVA